MDYSDVELESNGSPFWARPLFAVQCSICKQVILIEEEGLFDPDTSEWICNKCASWGSSTQLSIL
jgi:hypothetical protein